MHSKGKQDFPQMVVIESKQDSSQNNGKLKVNKIPYRKQWKVESKQDFPQMSTFVGSQNFLHVNWCGNLRVLPLCTNCITLNTIYHGIHVALTSCGFSLKMKLGKVV